jgi:SAM-dependent methyltransferase
MPVNLRAMDLFRRFSDRVEDYIQYRPGYPLQIVHFLEQNNFLPSNAHIADIGSGTGLSSQIFLDAGYRVTGVEPNDEMRKASEVLLAAYPDFTAVKGNAHASTMPDASVDMIVCAQAFHWLDRKLAAHEFRRILKPNGHVLLMWNDRDLSSPFMKAYEKIIDQHATDYNEMNHLLITDDIIDDWYADGIQLKSTFPFSQQFDLAGLTGRTSSCSYMPNRGAKGYMEMEKDIASLFHQYQQDGIVIFACTTRIYIGKL